MSALTILNNVVEEEDRAVFAPDGKPILSPTQHDKLDQCHAAWGFRYLDGQKVEKASSAKGTAVHAAQEIYFKQRMLPPSDEIGNIAMCGLKFCPHPDDSLGIEHYFALEVEPGYWERGKIDIYDPLRIAHFETEHLIGTYADEPGPWLPYHANPEHPAYGKPIPLIVDHKTTGDFKWMKTDAVLRGTTLLRGDPQPAIYGHKAGLDFKAVHACLPEWVHFRWIYYLTKKGDTRARAVDLRMTPDAIRANLMRWLPDSDIIAGYHGAGIKTGNDLPKKGGSACLKYGGCDYGPKHLNICHLSDGGRFKAAMATNLPLSQQVNAFLGTGAQQPAAPQGGMFGTQQPAAQTQQAPAATSMFGGQPAAQQQTTQPAPQGGMFGGGAPAAPAATGMFGGQPAAQQQAPAATQSAGMMSFMGAQQPAAQTAPVDPRLAEIPPNIPADRRMDWLKHCDAMGFDHRNGQPKGNGVPAAIPMAAAPATIPAAAPPVQQMQPVSEDMMKGAALAIYQSGSVPQPGTHPDIVKAFSAIVLMMGAKTPEQLAAANGSPAAVEKPAKRKRRTAAEMAAASGTPSGSSPLAHPDVIAFIREFRDFLDSFLPE